MYPKLDALKSALLKENYISEKDSQAAESQAHSTADYIDYLIREELISRKLLGQAIAESYGLPFADFEAHLVEKQNVEQIPEDFARTNRVVFIKGTDKVVAVASDIPEQVDKVGLDSIFKGKTVRIAYTLPEYIDQSLTLYAQPLETRFSQIIKGQGRIAPEIVDQIIQEALSFHASDIHFEPHPDQVVIRFRIDGTLRDAGTIPKEYYENVLNRVKVESGMRIDEHFSSQDGSIQSKGLGGYVTDLRVALMPTVEGEKIAIRVLSSYAQNFNLGDIGLTEENRKIFEKYAHKPFGMILNTGPTGSGKTTTLYALVKTLNGRDINITTIEDPVEYKIPGVNQIQVSEAKNITFSRGLRSIIRQDPDIILVGEIRDEETAQISINSALTGHLLLSTFHANDAATAIPRLIDLGIEPFLMSSTLQVLLAQRLVRKICEHCRYSMPAKEAINHLGITIDERTTRYFGPTDHVYAGKGCEVCTGTGYNGRTAIFEIIEVTPAMQDLILKSPSSQEVAALARKEGSKTMFEDGILKIKTGVTTLAEVLRVAEPPNVGVEKAI